ncbi:MAG: FHA domain-containing protein [Clostridia bacterium]|nr:FHA domain-containing protein [Clostridia bacterium]
MNSERFHLQQSAESAYLIIDLEEPEQLDDIAIQVIQDDCPEFLLPLHISALNGRRSLRYKLITATALKYSLGSKMSKRDFINFAIDLLTPFIKCKNWFLDYHYLCIDPTHILYDKNAERFMFVYMPEKSLGNTDDEIISFFERTLTNIDITDDQRYQIMLIRYFRDNRVMLSELYQMFSDEKGSAPAVKKPEQEKPITREPAQSSGTAASANTNTAAKVDTPAKSAETVPEEPVKKSGWGSIFGGGKKQKEKNLLDDDLLGDLDDDLLGDDFTSKSDKKKAKTEAGKPQKPAKTESKGSFFGGFGKSLHTQQVEKQPEQPKVQQPPVTQTVTQPPQSNPGYDPYGGNVTVIPGGNDIQRRYLELLDSAAPDEPPKVIELDFNKEYITIGRATTNGAAGSDLDVKFPPRCGVSRHHLRIYNKDGRLVAVDLGSAYFTLINGQRMTPNVEYELIDGATLVFVEKQPIRYHVHC